MTGPTINPDEDHVLAIGQTGSGKSAWLQAQLAQQQGQILIIDVKSAIRWRGEHQNVYGTPGQIDWTQRVIRYVPTKAGEDRDELNDVLDQAFRQGNVRVWLDESIGPTGPNYWPSALNRILVQGRSRGVTVWAGAQRPVGFAPNLRAQASHVVVFARPYMTRDLTDLAGEMGVFDSPRELRQALLDLNAEHGKLGKFAHLHFERQTGQVWALPPIPEWMLKL